LRGKIKALRIDTNVSSEKKGDTARVRLLSAMNIIKKGVVATFFSCEGLILYSKNANKHQRGLPRMFAHTSIRTSNMDTSINFYTKLMGLKLLSRHEIKQTNAEIAFLQDPEEKGAKLELTYYRNQKKFIQADYEDRLFDHVAFEIKDMDKTISRLRSEKVTITDEPYTLGPAGPLIAFIEDPDGTLIELIERK